MKKKVCVILEAGASTLTRQTQREDLWARRAMTENGFYILYVRTIPGDGNIVRNMNVTRDGHPVSPKAS